MLEHMGEVFGCIRAANVALRWLLLHTGALHRRLRGAVASAAPPPDALLALLLDTALLEFEVRIWRACCMHVTCQKRHQHYLFRLLGYMCKCSFASPCTYMPPCMFEMRRVGKVLPSRCSILKCGLPLLHVR